MSTSHRRTQYRVFAKKDPQRFSRLHFSYANLLPDRTMIAQKPMFNKLRPPGTNLEMPNAQKSPGYLHVISIHVQKGLSNNAWNTSYTISHIQFYPLPFAPPPPSPQLKQREELVWLVILSSSHLQKVLRARKNLNF